MPRINLTERSIAKLAAPTPSGQQVYHWDTTLRGFGVLCSGTSNLKTYVVQRDVHGKARRAKVAAVAELSLANARQRAREMLDDMRQGKDPGRRADRNMSLKTALDSYIASAKLRAPSVRAYRAIERTLADWLNIPLRDITPDMVEKKHGQIGAKSASTANLSFRAFRVMWNYAGGKIDDLPPCPTKALRKNWFEEKRRKRMVASAELANFHTAVMALASAIHRDVILTLMFSGMRFGECTSLRWSDIDFSERLIRLPAAATKANREIDLPMNDVVFDLLVARRALGRDKFVFPGASKLGHVNSLQYSFRSIAEKTGIAVSPHDLRRGFVTAGNSVGVPLAILKQLLNHAPSADTTLGYVIVELKELRDASQKIANELKRLCEIAEPASENVTRLRKAEIAVS